MSRPAPRAATPDDLPAVGSLLHDFNVEFGEPAPPGAWLAARLRTLVEGGDTEVLVAGPEPVAVAVLRFRPALWSAAEECYLAELYVLPAERGRGVGGRLMEAVVERARSRGASHIEIGVDEPDAVARHLYERMGFTNRVSGSDAVTFVYERDL